MKEKIMGYENRIAKLVSVYGEEKTNEMLKDEEVQNLLEGNLSLFYAYLIPPWEQTREDIRNKIYEAENSRLLGKISNGIKSFFGINPYKRINREIAKIENVLNK